MPIFSTLDSVSPTYDYIIVGGGTAGCVLAHRLSENHNATVLLLERGPVSDGWAAKVPLLSADFASDGSRTRKTESLPNSHLNNRTQGTFRGSVLGGTSRINQMLYIRGFPGEYDGWEADGLHGWSYESLEPLFKKSEAAQDDNADDNHGRSGPWKTRLHEEFYFPATSKLIAAAQELGIPYSDDTNAATNPSTNCSRVRYTMDMNGRRCSAYHAFLSPEVLKDRGRHLDVCVNALVTKIAFTEEAGDIRASTVQVRSHSGSVEKTITARKEIVLSAGSLGTPQTLMLSGIGPRDHLESLGIKVVKDLPGVGNHLQDHFSVPLGYFVPMSHSLLRIESITGFLKEMFRYMVYGTGLLLNPLPEMILFANSDLVDDNTGKVSGTPIQLDATKRENLPDFSIEPIAYDAAGGEFDKSKGAFSFLATLTRPKSTGTLRLQSTNPQDDPIVDLNFYSDPEDRIVMRKAIKFCMNLVKIVQKHGYDMTDYRVPASTLDEDLDAHVRTWGRTIYHYTSTCRMGSTATGPIPAVVDEQLRVHGIKGLRIADASVLPHSPVAYIQALAVVVAEKCAQMLSPDSK